MDINALNNWYIAASQHNILTEELSEKYQAVIERQIGNNEFNSWVEKYLGKDFLTLRNIVLTTGGAKLMVDHLILTPRYWLVTTVRNNEADYYYQNGLSKVGDNEIQANLIAEAESIYSILLKIVKNLKRPPKIISCVTFINQHCRVHTDYEGLVHVLMRCDIRDFLFWFKEKVKDKELYKKPAETVSFLEEFKADISIELPSYNKLNWKNLKKGIFCKECGSKEIQSNSTYYKCRECLTREEKRDTVLRIVDNYCILYQKKEFKVSEIFQFLDGEIEEETLLEILNANFNKDKLEMKGVGRYEVL